MCRYCQSLYYYCRSETGSGVQHIQHGGVVERRQRGGGGRLGAGAELPPRGVERGVERVHGHRPSPRCVRRLSFVAGALQRFRVRRSVVHVGRRLLQVRPTVRVPASAAAAVGRRAGRVRRLGRARSGRLGRGVGRRFAVASALHGPQHVRLPELPGGGPPRPGRGAAPAEAQRPQLPSARLRQGLQQNVAPQGAPALAHRRTPVPLQLAVLRQTLHAVRRAAATHPDSHGRETVRLLGLLQEVHALRPPQQAHQDPPEYQEDDFRFVVVGAGRRQRRQRRLHHDVIAAPRRT